MATYKPFQFIRTVVVWGTDREDAEGLLPEVLAEAHDDLLYGWEYDSGGLMETKKSVYNMLCAALYNYERPEYNGEIEVTYDMYNILCVIQRHWDDIQNPNIEPLTPLG